MINILFVFVIVILLLVVLVMSLFVVSYLQTLDAITSVKVVALQIYSLFYPKVKFKAYQEAYKLKSRKVLTVIVNTKDKDLLKKNPELKIADIKRVKEISAELLKDKSYGITLEQSKEMLEDMGELDFFYSFQSMVEFYSDPRNQSCYDRVRSKKTSSKNVNLKRERIKLLRFKSKNNDFYDSLVNTPNIIKNIKNGNLSFN
ncbi:hypothetical protein GP420_002546 [Enterococcus faecalis]|nr:hypothetical protein [Enterococcus faecalis]